MNNNDFKELENKKFTVLEESETLDITGGGAFDFILDIINYFRGN
ncbi:hypothetical protein [Diplocloster agilis]|nr:hypothetical protein [Suonthocola fibrivorans]MCU6736809.1 hypothetical protein [Suonthocola fibrivorans]SCJ93775.1 Uncharacterised protein [uncultured Clostridium sp.]